MHMKKIHLFFAGILLLLFCMAPVTALADSQSTTVRYSVPATIIYQDHDGTSTTQKVEVGTLLKAPQPKERPGYAFAGWRDAATGLLWDFTQPVTEHLTLVASYVKLPEDTNGIGGDHGAGTDGTGGANGTDVNGADTSDTQTSGVTKTTFGHLKTGDPAHLLAYEIMLGLSAAMFIVLFCKKKKEE